MRIGEPVLDDRSGDRHLFRRVECRGAVMRFINDHDPLPLLNQIAQRYDGQVHHEYLQNNADAVVIDFTIHPKQQLEATAAAAGAAAADVPQSGGCGGGGGGCGCGS